MQKCFNQPSIRNINVSVFDMLHTSIGLALLGALSACTDASPLRKTNPIVDIAKNDQIHIQGTSSDNVESFLNIRFGQNTAGNNRFAAPKPFEYPSGSLVNATAPGAACPQQSDPGFQLFDNVTNISEDCLTLRVDRPASTNSSAKLPVMVWIYGGGDSIGQIYDSAYNPAGLVLNAARKGTPIIYIAMNYRVGVFGFASSPALNATDSLNAGLLDQRLGLEWVQRHIAAFGGDPDNVTIFGESDGGTGVGLQVTAYGGKGKVPFKRAIMESGSPGADSGVSNGVSAKHTAEFTKAVGCSASSSAEELACLRKLPLNKILSRAVEYELTVSSNTFDVFVPAAPSKFIPDSPSKLLASGRFAPNIDMIAGWAENDASFFTDPYVNGHNATEYAASIFNPLNKTDEVSLAEISKATKQALELYPLSSFPAKLGESPYFYRASQMSRDSEFTCPAIYAISMNHKHFGSKTSNYLYALNQTAFTPVLEENGIPFFQTPHFSDVPYVFNQISTQFASNQTRPSDIKLSSQVSASWASFASHGKPSQARGTLPGWSDAVESNSQLSLQVIGGPKPGPQSIGSKDSFENLMERCAFWNSEKVQTLLGI